MNGNGHNLGDLMTRYLLGDVTEEERARLDERCFTDDRFFEESLAAEERLIDDYLQNRLPPRDRALFESHFLSSPCRRSKVDFASALMQKLSVPPRPAYAGRLAMAAVFLLLLGATVFLSLQNARLRHRPESVPPPSPVVSFILTPGLVRDTSTRPPTLLIPSGARVRLQLDLPASAAGKHQNYRGFLQTADGDQVWQQDLPAATPLTVELPPDLLTRNDYILELFGPEPLGTYFFRAVPR